MDRSQLESLLAHVDAAVVADGCDHTLRATEAWADRHDVDLERLHDGLEEFGGYCDCEVVMTVDPGEVFTPVRRPRS
ncbi:DUF2695 domain-containing protein [Blastococcus sp. SYSU D00922]